VKNKVLESIGEASRNYTAIIIFLGSIIAIIGTGFTLKARVERLEDRQVEVWETLRGKVDENLLTIHLGNIQKKLDDLNTDIKWLIKRKMGE
jgi:hypothetical protein